MGFSSLLPVIKCSIVTLNTAHNCSALQKCLQCFLFIKVNCTSTLTDVCLNLKKKKLTSYNSYFKHFQHIYCVHLFHMQLLFGVHCKKTRHCRAILKQQGPLKVMCNFCELFNQLQLNHLVRMDYSQEGMLHILSHYKVTYSCIQKIYRTVQLVKTDYSCTSLIKTIMD